MSKSSFSWISPLVAGLALDGCSGNSDNVSESNVRPPIEEKDKRAIPPPTPADSTGPDAASPPAPNTTTGSTCG